MTATLNTQTTAPNSAPATRVSPRDPSGSSKTKFSKTRKTTTDLYQIVTDSIIDSLESGVKPWVCPWKRASGMSGLPTNYATGTASGACISERGNSAYFQPATDEVVLPERHLFNDAANFYATALHELTHWSGGKKTTGPQNER